ncbi:MAG TPA: molybdopterin-binding protein [Thermomicrobiales bacterium]|nr:molybdopterin-binding protein [Thermomicrobiales bacterium]
MQPIVIDPTAPLESEQLVGAVIAEEVRAGGRRRFHKGHRLTPDDLPLLESLERPIHAVRLGPGDVHEDEAGGRLARAVAAASPDLEIRGPVQSRYNLVATVKGLLRVDPHRLLELNRLPGIAIFTLEDRMPVVPDRVVTGAKITPVAIPEATVQEAERLLAAGPAVRLLPFQPLRVRVVTTEPLAGRLRERFETAVRRKIEWYGGAVLGFAQLPPEADAVAAAIEDAVAAGADLVLAAGGNTIDPLDPTLRALDRLGAEMARSGAPAHPGSMFWLAYRGETPIFNLASCSMYSQATVGDLVLPWIMAGERVTRDDLAGIGYGGLLDRGAGHRFPPYGDEAASDGDEE